MICSAASSHVRKQLSHLPIKRLLALGIVFLVLIIVSVAGLLNSPDPSELQEARRLDAKGDAVGANAMFRAVLDADPSNLEAHRGLAVNLALLGEWDKALPHQKAVVRLDHTDEQSRVELAFNYLNYQEDPRAAVAALEEAVQVNPSPRNRTFLAQAIFEQGDSSRAEGLLEEVIAENPRFEFAYYVLLNRLDSQGKLAEAATIREVAAGLGLNLWKQQSGSEADVSRKS